MEMKMLQAIQEAELNGTLSIGHRYKIIVLPGMSSVFETQVI